MNGSTAPAKNKKPRPWDPDAARGGSALLLVALLVSVVLHSGIPLGGLWWPRQSVTQLPVTMVIETLPLPPAEELVEAPDDADVPAPPEPEPTPEPSPQPTPPKPADPEPPAEPAAPDEPEPEPPPGDPPPPPDLAATPDSQAELAARIAEREKRRAEWLAERERRRAEREKRREARRKAREAAEKGGAPEAGSTHGQPEPVYLCTATDKGTPLKVRTERPLTSWMPILPTVFAHFETRPNLGTWLSKTSQVYVPRKRVGLMDFASPTEVMQMKLEEPRGVTLAVGRLDARCIVGLTYRPKLFPIKLSRVPARIIDRQNNTVAALINLTIYKDATLEIEPFDTNQPALPFKKGAFKNHKLIARNIEDHFQAVRLANSFAELFGFKPKPPSKRK